MKQKYFLSIIIAVSMLAFSANFALAGTATLSWNANSESDLASYKIYYGTSARTGTDPKVCTLCGYSSSINVGNVRTYTFGNLTDNLTYYFSVSALDTSGNESSFSSQVSKFISQNADLSGDGYVNMQDASILMSYWGNISRPAADLNQDGYVNMQDASIMMSQWG